MKYRSSFGIVVALASLLLLSGRAYAVAAPEACFAFDVPTQTITDYFDNENNNPLDPSCPRAVEVPSSISGVAVRAIGGTSDTVPSNGAFREKQITSILLPASVTRIGDNAFMTNQLTSLVLPNTVTSVGAYSFYDNSIGLITPSSSLVTIGEMAFSHNNITQILLPNTVTTIGPGAFTDNKITNFTIPDSVTSLSPAMCWGYTAQGILENNPLVSLDTGDGLVEIPICAFSHSGLGKIDTLKTVRLGTSIQRIGVRAFERNQLTNIVIPDSVISIEHSAFSRNELSSITLGAQTTTIGPLAFSFNHLQSANLPNAVATIANDSFSYQSDTLLDRSDLAFTIPPLNSIYYARLYTEDPANPQNLQDGSLIVHKDETIGYCTQAAPCPEDFNQDGDMVDVFDGNYGGHLINPAAAVLMFSDNNGNALQPSQMLTGSLAGSRSLQNYYVEQGPVVPTPNDAYNLTPIERQAVQNALSVYYRIGDNVVYAAPIINGITPTPSTYSFVLRSASQGAEVNSKVFTYASAANSASQLASTGSSLYSLVSVVAATLLMSIALSWRQMYLYKKLR